MKDDHAGGLLLVLVGIALLLIGLLGTQSNWAQGLYQPLGIVFGRPGWGTKAPSDSADTGNTDTGSPDTTGGGEPTDTAPPKPFDTPPEADPFASLPLPEVPVP